MGLRVMSVPRCQEVDLDHLGCELVNDLRALLCSNSPPFSQKRADMKVNFIFKDACRKFASKLFLSLMRGITKVRLSDTRGMAIHMAIGAFTS